jgi:glycosyltransferase involved in cell wall biosynthesis
MLPPRQRRWLFAQGTAALAPKPDRPPPPALHGIAVGGELSRPTGLGEGARLMRAALDQLGIASWGQDVGDRLPGGQAARLPLEMPPPGAPLVLHENPPSLPWALLRLPRDLIRGRHVIGYWAWELPVAPPSWRAGLPFVHSVWVPSQFTAAALRPMLPADGRIALHVVPHPVAAAPPVPSALGRAEFGLPTDALIVLVSASLASSFTRKNPLAAIAAFQAAFGNRTDRLLLLKLNHVDHFPADFAAVRAAVADAPNIRIETRVLPYADRHALTACADILLSLHRSEGFGLVLAEAMLLGVPVVATGWSGNMDFMDAETAALVNFRLVPARDPRGVMQVPGAVWAEPDIADAAAQLRQLAADPDARRALGARGAAMARQRLGSGPMVAAIKALGL